MASDTGRIPPSVLYASSPRPSEGASSLHESGASHAPTEEDDEGGNEEGEDDEEEEEEHEDEDEEEDGEDEEESEEEALGKFCLWPLFPIAGGFKLQGKLRMISHVL
jgi:hypothetical protein